jgi:SHS2 domain-containing protein
MNIKTITIKNVRGINLKTVTLNMIPNKPSILVAPNGTGKSSFAFAFQWLNRFRIKLNEEDAYNNDVNNKPELIIETDEANNNIYKANENQNEISKKFGVFVINNSLKAISPGIKDGISMGKSRITVPDIELIGKIPNSINIVDDFNDVYNLRELPVGLFPKANTIFSDNHIMDKLDLSSIKCGNRDITKIVQAINTIKGYNDTIENCHNKIMEGLYDNLYEIPSIKYVSDILKELTTDNELKCLLKSIRIVTYSYRNPKNLKTRIEYAKYKINESKIREVFNTMKQTWRGIKPHIKEDRMLLSIGDAQRISNGERDTLTFIAMLIQAETSFTKKDNILIIDEVFDYMDDANLVAAQHYINKFVSKLKDEGKNIYPIILSHINPTYYKTFAFKDMKVYYLNKIPYPHASDNMLKLIRRREDLEKEDKEKANLISKYMLHFYNSYDYDMTDIIQIYDPKWGDVHLFKSYCKNHLEKYISNEEFDALAVCVALREIIEEYCYNKLVNDEHKRCFLDNIHGTGNKINYVENLGIICPETFHILGLIYNDPLHATNKNNIDLRQTLYSRLENNTIKGIIEEIYQL